MFLKKRWIIAILLLVIGYLMGPRPAAPVYRKDLPAIPQSPNELETYVRNREKARKVKPDNEARIEIGRAHV